MALNDHQAGESPVGAWGALAAGDQSDAVLSALGWTPDFVIQTAKLLSDAPDAITTLEHAAGQLDKETFPLSHRSIAFAGALKRCTVHGEYHLKGNGHSCQHSTPN